MPYILPEKRKDTVLDCPGNLNYVITRTIREYMKVNGENYTTFNDIIGVLEAAKMEFYRRVAAPYEDVKMRENGDAY